MCIGDIAREKGGAAAASIRKNSQEAEVADAIVLFASPLSDHLTGQVPSIGVGLTMIA